MAYEKQTWVKGDKITAAKLNHLEDGVSSLSEEKVNLPKNENGESQNGTDGQILQTNGDGTTQWVDKPDWSGTDTWELINEAIVTEEVGPIIFTKDKLGNDFSLKKAYINCMCVGIAESTSAVLLIFNLSDIANDRGYKIASTKNGITAAGTTRAARSACYIEKVGETFFSISTYSASANYETTPIENCNFNCIYPDKDNGDYKNLEKISKICLWSNSYYQKPTFGVGTVIKLWGVRE